MEFRPTSYPGEVNAELYCDDRIEYVWIPVESDAVVFVDTNGTAILVIETGRRRGGHVGLNPRC